MNIDGGHSYKKKTINVKGGNIKMAKITSVKTENPKFKDIKKWYEDNMSPDVVDFDDPEPYKIYSEGRWAGVFQCSGGGARKLFQNAKPESIVDIATLTSIYRPGPLAANVDKLYIEAKKGNLYDWKDPRIGELLKETAGCLVGESKILTEHGEITIQKIVDEQMIGTRLISFNDETGNLEYDEIVAGIMTGVKGTLEIEVESGNIIELTEDHLVRTNRGWIKAGDLTLDDSILEIVDCNAKETNKV